MTVELAEYSEQILAVKAEAAEFLADVTDAQANWNPAPDAWSIAQCFAHLAVTGRQFIVKIDDTIERARSEGAWGGGPYRYGVVGRYFLRSFEPPVKRRLPAPRLFRPRDIHSITRLADEFDRLQDDVLARYRAADGLDLKRIRMSSPATRLIRFSLGVWLAAIPAHERRHLWQARQVAAAMEAPE